LTNNLPQLPGHRLVTTGVVEEEPYEQKHAISEKEHGPVREQDLK